MVILGIETSCDETAASVVEDGTKVLSHVLASSAQLHTKTGGIIPEIAAREQIKVIIPVIQEAIENCKLKIENLDALAVTVGPGLIGSLLVGVETAKTLAYVWNKPIIPANHLVGHIYANWLLPDESPPPEFPALALVVSGGHTDLVFMEGHGKIRWIGGTRDDAAGEAFDKTARLLGLPYPGGPEISKLAEQHINKSPITNYQSLTLFPRPLLDQDNYDWSFSGLKTAIAREINKKNKLTEEDKKRLAAEIQEAIIDVLITKTIRAVKKFKPKSLLLGGGVAANSRLRERFKSEISKLDSGEISKLDSGEFRNLKLEINLSIAPPKYCTDNASMIATAAFYNYKTEPWQKITALPSLNIIGEV